MLRLAKWRSRTKKDAVYYDERVASDETSDEGRTGIPETRMFLKEAPATVGLFSREKERERKRKAERDKGDTRETATTCSRIY